MRKYHLFILLVFTLILKVALIEMHGNFNTMSPDEERNYSIAQNYVDGNGYTFNNKPSAFTSSLTVFIYQFLIENNIAKELWITFFHYVCILFFVLSVYYFYHLLINLQIAPTMAFIAGIIYILYPSNLIFIGNFYLLEKLALPLLVIAFYFFHLSVFELKVLKPITILFISMAVAFSCFLRHQLIMIYAVIFIFLWLFPLFSNRIGKLFNYPVKLSLTVAIFIILLSVPVLIKNHHSFNAYFLSTQTGAVLTHGHSDIARGSFYGSMESFNSYSKQIMPDIEGLNEYEESKARTALALKWILNNPLKELKLIARKVILFFVPGNFHSGINGFTALIHLLFAVSLCFAMVKRVAFWDCNYTFVLSPVLAALLLSVLTFVGYRWRYYAEPFFIVSIFYILNQYLYYRKLDEDPV